MELAFGPPLTLGLRQAGRFDRIVDLETCLLMSTSCMEVVGRVRHWAATHGLSGYDRRMHCGDLRYLILREGKNTGERMAILIAHPTARGRISIDDLRDEIGSLVNTCWVGWTDSLSDVARTQEMECLWGPVHIHETLGRLRFRISPYSFFQTNTHGTEKLYSWLAEWAGSENGALLDVYCGSGGIALSLATHFDRVIGIDSNHEAIQDAQWNAVQNGLLNTEFVAGDAEDFLKKLPSSKLAVQLSAVVVDPPRPGLHPKALRALLDLAPSRLAYVSCNPETLARDLQALVPFYAIRTVQTIDLFPHTPHVETLATLEHR